jgi:hypothetical protein
MRFSVHTGLSDTELMLVRERARTALHPEQAQMQQQLAKSRNDLRGGLEGAGSNSSHFYAYYRRGLMPRTIVAKSTPDRPSTCPVGWAED